MLINRITPNVHVKISMSPTTRYQMLDNIIGSNQLPKTYCLCDFTYVNNVFTPNAPHCYTMQLDSQNALFMLGVPDAWDRLFVPRGTYNLNQSKSMNSTSCRCRQDLLQGAAKVQTIPECCKTVEALWRLRRYPAVN